MKAEIKKIKESLLQNDLPTARKLILASEKQLKNYPALIHMEAIYHAQTGHFEESLAAFAMASKTLPRDATLFYNMACLLRAMKRLSAAMEAIDRSLRLNPFNPLALYERAQILTLQGKHQEAILGLWKCLQRFSLFFPAYAALTQYLLLDNHKDLAIQIYEAAHLGAPEESFFKEQLERLKAL